MSWSSFFFSWVFVVGFGFHYWQVKAPDQSREIASQQKTVQPWYDASFKL